MSGLISTGSFPQDLRPGIRMWFGSAYKLYDTKYDKILDVKVPDDRAYEEDVMMNTFGLAQVKTQGAPVEYDTSNQFYSTRYDHIQYGLGFVITQEMMDDGIALKLGEVFSKAMKQSMLRSREIIGANVYVNGFSSSYLMQGGDGVALFSASHPTSAGNLSNVPSAPASLSEAALEQAVVDIMNYKDNRGQLIMTKPDKLIVPLALQFTAARILDSVLQSNTANNNINALRDLGMIPGGVVVNPYLTSASNWFIKTDEPGLNFFNRKDITLSDDNEFDTENGKFKALMRLSVGWSDWRAGYGVNA
jgi:hypothetical protein